MIEKVVGKDHGRMDCKDTQKMAIIDRGSSGLGHRVKLQQSISKYSTDTSLLGSFLIHHSLSCRLDLQA